MKTIFTGFSPNTTAQDLKTALGFLLLPWKWFYWKRGSAVNKAEEIISEYFEGVETITYDSGRSALFFALQAFGIEEGDEVLVQAFTCVVVINAIKWTGATPVYVDILPDTLNMDETDARKKVNPKTKAIIIQHTFGLPADLESLLRLAEEHNLKTIEDCAHSLGAKYKGKFTGTFANIGMLSFGGEKVISCVRGGALITKNPLLANKLREVQKRLPKARCITIFQHLMHVVLFPIGKKYYHLYIGKLLLKITKTLHITNRIISDEEKKGNKSNYHPTKLSNALASLLLLQIPKIDKLNEHRKKITSSYNIALDGVPVERQVDSPERVYLRYPLFVGNPEVLLAKAKKRGVMLGNWYSLVVGPGDVDMVAVGYKPGTCPIAEHRSKNALNLPTNIHIQEGDVKRIISSIIE
jgi:perosamine synthetase